jgi:hypothetical protein
MRRLIVLTAIFASACGSVAASGDSDRSYDRIEDLRASRAVEADHTYDRVEQLRDQRFTTPSVSSDPYDTIEANRLSR